MKYKFNWWSSNLSKQERSNLIKAFDKKKIKYGLNISKRRK